MNRRKSCILTVLVMLLLLACAGAALIIPQLVSGWYEEQALGQVAYHDLFYEPYEIRYYESFEEKMDAIASRKMQGVQTYSIRIGERTDNITNEDLIDIANEELVKLYEVGLLPEKIRVRSLLGRTLLELYEIQEVESDEDESDSLRNVYLWELDCVTDYGTMLMRMDNEYYRIYSFSLYQEPHAENLDQWYEWQMPYLNYDRAAIAQGWIDYWELTGAVEETELYRDEMDGSTDKKTPLSDASQWAMGETNVWLYIDMQSGNTIILSVNLYGFYEKGWGINWNLYDF